MTTLKISPARAKAFITVRTIAQDDPEGAKTLRKTLWSSIRDQFGVPEEIKLKVELDNTAAPNYLVLTDKRTGAALHGNKFGVYRPLPTAPRPPAARWFYVSKEALTDLVADIHDFEDGVESLDELDADEVILFHDKTVGIDIDGGVYIKLGDADF